MFCLIASFGKFIDVNINQKKGWYYIGRFVFNGIQSEGKITSNLNGVDSFTNLFLYSEANVNWPEVYGKRHDCDFITGNKHATRIFVKSEFEVIIEKTPAPTFWYIAVANCENDVKVSGTLHLQDVEWEKTKVTYN